MSTKITVTCDIDECSKDGKTFTMDAVFTTEQTEGRSSRPYPEAVKVDLCEEHYREIINAWPLTATGAQGYNTYKVKPIGEAL